MGKKVHHFNGWQSVTANDKWHYFKEGVSLCGRYSESRISRRGTAKGEKPACANCEKARARQVKDGTLGK